MSIAADLLAKINSRKAVVGVMGLGYVGLPLVREFCASGFKVIGFDVDKRKVDMLHAGKTYIKHLPGGYFKKLIADGLFKPTTDMGQLGKPDAILICVPTPLAKNWDPDMRFVIGTTEAIEKTLRKGQLVVLESTTYPGTTKELCRPILDQAGLKLEQEYFLAFSPEREDPGRTTHTTRTIPKVVGGIGPNSAKLAQALYGQVIDQVVPVSSCEVAEAAKILENVYRCINIALVNELKIIFERMGIDVWEVIEAAKTKPFGFSAYYPGPGLGGHCIPIDPLYLSWKARQYGKPTRFIELAAEINSSMPEYVVAQLAEALSRKCGKPLAGSKILIPGLAYKKDVDDLRESPSVVLIEQLQHRGAKVQYHDPFIPSGKEMREHNITNLRSVPLTPQSVRQYDAVLISTDHTDIDYAMVVKNARLVVDSRNATARVKGAKKNVVKA
ncbi:MAG: nucleotide sugar dehydrogenase [Planctomycetes bacterium]|nr:nucleotide sugar dehydrogenase [Planctomycetota bacterium]